MLGLSWPVSLFFLFLLASMILENVNTQGFRMIQAFGHHSSRTPPAPTSSPSTHSSGGRLASVQGARHSTSKLPNLPTLSDTPIPTHSDQRNDSSDTSSNDGSVLRLTFVSSSVQTKASSASIGTFQNSESVNSTVPSGTGSRSQYRPSQARESTQTNTPPQFPAQRTLSTLHLWYKTPIATGEFPPYPTQARNSRPHSPPNTPRLGSANSRTRASSVSGHKTAAEPPIGTAPPYQASLLGRPKYMNSTSNHGSASGNQYPSGITLGTAFTANASIVWGRQPACTASWKSRLAANNGTVMTTRIDYETFSLATPITTTWAVSKAVTGPTTEVVKAGTFTGEVIGGDACCGWCQLRYPNVKVYYWPVTKNANTWCLKYNFSTDAATEINFDRGKAIFGTLSSTDSQETGPKDLPALTTSVGPENSGFSVLPGVDPRPHKAGRLPNLTSSVDASKSSAEPSHTGSSLSVLPKFGIPPGGLWGGGRLPRALPPVTESASLPESPAHALRPRTFVPLNGSSVYALAPDGIHTFTSPSIYVVISTISARDKCGQLGNAYTSLTLSFDADQLSTVDGVTAETRVFNFEDLPCPPQKWVNDIFMPNPLLGNSALQSAMAKSYHPRILVPPKSLLGLDPLWASSSCTVIDVGNGYDPPRPLVPVTALAVSSSTSEDPGTPSAAPAQGPDPEGASPACTVCADARVHTSVQAMTPTRVSPEPTPVMGWFHSPQSDLDQPDPSDEAHSSRSELGQPDPPPINPASLEFTEEVHSTQAGLGVPRPSPVTSAETMFSAEAHITEAGLGNPASGQLHNPGMHGSPPKMAEAHQTRSLLWDSPGSPVAPNANPNPVQPPSPPQQPAEVPANPVQPVNPDDRSPKPAPIPSAVVIGGQTLSNNGAPLHVNGNTQVPVPQPAPLVIPKDSPEISAQGVPGEPVPAQPQPAPINVAGLTLRPGNTSPAAQEGGQSPSNGSPSQNSETNNGNDQSNRNSGASVDSNPMLPADGPLNAGLPDNAPPQSPPQATQVNAKPGAGPVVAGGVTLIPVPNPQNGGSPRQNPSPVALGDAAAATVRPAIPGAPNMQGDPTIQPVAAQPPAQVSVGGNPVVLGPSHAVIAGTTISQGAAPKVIVNTPVSLGSSALVVGSSTLPLQQAPARPVATVAGQPVIVNPSSGLLVGGSSVQPGSKATVGGTVISAPKIGGAVIGTNTIPPSKPGPLSLAPAPVFTLGGSTFAGNPSSINIGDTVLSRGSAVIIANTPISLGIHGLVIGSSTVPAASLNGVPPASHAPSAFVVSGSTLAVGGPGFNVKGTSVSVASNGIVVGGSTISIPEGNPLPSIAGQRAQTAPNGNVVVAGQTVTAGGPAATIDGSTLSVLPSGSGVVVDGQSTIAIPKTALPTVAGQLVQPASNADIVIAGHTITAGGSAAAIDASTLSLLPAGTGLVVNGQVIVPIPRLPTITGYPVQTASNGNVVIGSQTLSRGARATIAGTHVSILPDGKISVAGSTIPFNALTTPNPDAGHAHPSVYSIDGTALTEGSSPITIHNTPIFLGASGLLIVGSSTTHIPSESLITPAPIPSNGYVIAGHTLTPQEVLTISGTRVSLGLNSKLVIDGTRTINLAAAPSPSIFDVAGHVFTAAPTGFVIDGSSLYPGEVTTISGTRISLNPMGVVIASKTYNLPSSDSVYVVDGQRLTANANGYSIDGQELSFGHAATVDGKPISLATTGAIFVGTDSVPLASMTPVRSGSGYNSSANGTQGAVGSSSVAVASSTEAFLSSTGLASPPPAPTGDEDSGSCQLGISRFLTLWVAGMLVMGIVLGSF